MKKTLFLCFLLLVLHSGMVAQPTAIAYQGKLLDAGGNAITITQNNVAMNFAMFDASTGGSLLWPASGTVAKTVDIAQGLYSVQLGTGVSGDPVFTAAMFNGKTPWLEVKVGTSTLSRTPFTNLPFALTSNELGALGWASPGAMGSTTPNIGKFTTLRADTVTAATFNGELKGNAATASRLKGGANGALPYQSGAGATTMLAAGADGNVLTLASGVPSWAMPLRNAVTVATTANPAPTGNYAINEYYLTALAEAAAFAAPSGTPANGNTLLIRIKDNGTTRSVTWDAVYKSFAGALPSQTVAGKTMYLELAFNSTSARWELASLFIQGSCSPSTPVAGTHTPSGTQIIWKWHSVPGATGYKWGTTDNFIAATDMSTDTVKTETGLTHLTIYTRYVWAYNSCGNSAQVTLTDTTTLKIGDNYQGGIIAYILVSGDPGYDANVRHGLIAAPTYQSTGAPWGCQGTLITGADGTAIGTGNQNTQDIVAGCSTAGIAAKICNDLVLNDYSDWYLPSKDELNKLYLNRDAIGGFTPHRYWSSSEYGSTDAWRQAFSNGDQGHYEKRYSCYVRAVRAF